jgi:hypothetical protein
MVTGLPAAKEITDMGKVLDLSIQKPFAHRLISETDLNSATMEYLERCYAGPIYGQFGLSRVLNALIAVSEARNERLKIFRQRPRQSRFRELIGLVARYAMDFDKTLGSTVAKPISEEELHSTMAELLEQCYAGNVGFEFGLERFLDALFSAYIVRIKRLERDALNRKDRDQYRALRRVDPQYGTIPRLIEAAKCDAQALDDGLRIESACPNLADAPRRGGCRSAR